MTQYKDMTRFEQFVIIASVVLFAVFTIWCIVVTSQRGYKYCDTILVRSVQDGNTIYAGKVDGEEARFTVSSDGSITFTYGEKVYGPYTVKNDASAMPKGKDCVAGLEVRDKGEVIFRGGYAVYNGYRSYYNQDGSFDPSDFTVSSSNGGIMKDADGNIIDQMKPSIGTLVALAEGPKIEHNGSWLMWFIATLLAGSTVFSVFYADALFRLRLSWHVQDVDMLEPAGWEIDRRMIGWGLSLFLVLFIYISALQ